MDKRTLPFIVAFLFLVTMLPLLSAPGPTPEQRRALKLEEWRRKWPPAELKRFDEWVHERPAKFRNLPEAYAAYKVWQRQQGTAAPSSATDTRPATAPSDGPRERFLADPERKAALVPLACPNFDATLSTAGGTLDSLTFKTIKDSSFRPIEHGKRELVPFQPLRTYTDPRDPVAVRGLELTPIPSDLDPEMARSPWRKSDLPGGGVRFEWVLPSGDASIVKEIAPATSATDYHFRLKVTIENRGPERKLGYALSGPAGMVEQSQARSTGLEAVVATRDRNGAFELTSAVAASVVDKPDKAPSVKDDTTTGTRIAWFGLRTKYFAAVVIPRGERRTVAATRIVPLLALAGRRPRPEDLLPEDDAPAKQVVVQGIVPEDLIPAGGKLEDEYLVYVGPRSETVLETGAYRELGLDNLIEWGWPATLSRLLTLILTGFHALTGNWGVAIILLTIVVRASMHPVSYWGQKSMLKMQKIQPEMQKLKAKFEDKDGNMSPQAQREFNLATMDVYKKHGIHNIAAGCLGPMFLQIPVFIALYGSVNHVFELRQAPFALWIKDLSEPDVVLRLPWAIFLGHGTNALSILPILMIVLYVFQMRLQPPPADPKMAEQQKIMQWMMPVMGYMFWTMPSGLLLYFVTTTTISMVESKWVKHRLKKLEEAGKA